MTEPAAPHPFVTARWERLAMINYEIDPGPPLSCLLPEGSDASFVGACG